MMRKISAGPYTLELPPNGVAILYQDGQRLPGGVGHLEALVQFAGEVIRLQAMLEAMNQASTEEFYKLIEMALIDLNRVADANETIAKTLSFLAERMGRGT